MKYILLILISSFLTSCSVFYRVVLGIKNPKMESYSSINEYAKTLNIDPKNLVFAKDSASMTELNKIFMGNPEVLIFNKSKMFLPYKNDSVACNAPIDIFLKNICDIETTHAPIKKEINFNHFISLLDDHSNALGIIKNANIDFIVFANFVKYVPKVNSTHLPAWNKELNNHLGNCNAKIIYVNLDYLESWGITKKSLPKIRLKANKK